MSRRCNKSKYKKRAINKVDTPTPEEQNKRINHRLDFSDMYQNRDDEVYESYEDRYDREYPRYDSHNRDKEINPNMDTHEMLRRVCDKLNFVLKKMDKIEDKQDQILQRITKVETKVASNEGKIQSIKKKQKDIAGNVIYLKEAIDPPFIPERTLVVYNTPYGIGDDKNIAIRLVRALEGTEDMILNVLRTQERNEKKGVLKIELKSN